MSFDLKIRRDAQPDPEKERLLPSLNRLTEILEDDINGRNVNAIEAAMIARELVAGFPELTGTLLRIADRYETNVLHAALPNRAAVTPSA